MNQTNVCTHELQAIKPFINKVPNNIFPQTDSFDFKKMRQTGEPGVGVEGGEIGSKGEQFYLLAH